MASKVWNHTLFGRKDGFEQKEGAELSERGSIGKAMVVLARQLVHPGLGIFKQDSSRVR